MNFIFFLRGFFSVISGFCLFFSEGWEQAECLVGLWKEENMIKVYLSIKIVLNNKDAIKRKEC